MRSTLFCRMSAIVPCVALVFLLISGCSKEEVPKTYIVKGICVMKNGKPLKGGSITFMSVANPELRGYGSIEKDGTFTLDTVALRSDSTSEKLAGAVEGEFRVNIRPDAGSTDGGPEVGDGKPAFTLKKTYKIEAKELNEITVTVE